MGNQVSWTNLNADGRRLERIIKLCETNISTYTSKDVIDHDIILAYIDRLIKATATKQKIVDLVLGISHMRKIAEAKLEQPKVYLK